MNGTLNVTNHVVQIIGQHLFLFGIGPAGKPDHYDEYQHACRYEKRLQETDSGYQQGNEQHIDTDFFPVGKLAPASKHSYHLKLLAYILRTTDILTEQPAH